MLSAAAFFIAGGFFGVLYNTTITVIRPLKTVFSMSESLAEEDGQGGEGYETSSPAKGRKLRYGQLTGR